MRRKDFQHIIGIDEVGRGPIAGVVTIGVVVVPQYITKCHFRGVRDSKQLTARAREQWVEKIQEKQTRGIVSYTVASTGNNCIDDIGISRSIQHAINRALRRFDVDPRHTLVLLDGGLKAPEVFPFQKTIIGGDQKEFVIALASIVAKVSRDRKMVRLAKKYPEYGFEQHKGYGTRKHFLQIATHGLCPLHRRSFLDGIAENS